MGSVLKHLFPPNRNQPLKHLDQEVIIAWNGPSIPQCDRIMKDTIDRMHGAGKWHFVRTARPSKLRFSKVSEAVDNLLIFF
jgi:hypothetical protein